jgi:hypothetical protein
MRCKPREHIRDASRIGADRTWTVNDAIAMGWVRRWKRESMLVRKNEPVVWPAQPMKLPVTFGAHRFTAGGWADNRRTMLMSPLPLDLPTLR